jgi:hypothetical protein
MLQQGGRWRLGSLPSVEEVVMHDEETQIERQETGIRILLSLLFLLIAEIVRIALGVTVFFALAWTLVTKCLGWGLTDRPGLLLLHQAASMLREP